MCMNISVLGSCNLDFVVKVKDLPRLGETIFGLDLRKYAGGKGANQAVAAARLGGHVLFCGKIGSDVFGEEILQSLRENHVLIHLVEKERDFPSGTALIYVTEKGDNAIVYVPGANAKVDYGYVDRVLPQLAAAKVLLLQFEIPIETIAYLLQHLPSEAPLVILDPAPAQDFSGIPLERVDIITPNRGELTSLTGEKELAKAARRLLSLGVKTVICKAGSDGAYLIDKSNFYHSHAFPVSPVDTTAAGDAFNGALAVALVEGLSMEEALRFANAAGALATLRPGAQPSLPTRQEVEAFLQKACLPK